MLILSNLDAFLYTSTSSTIVKYGTHVVEDSSYSLTFIYYYDLPVIKFYFL
jgi:hypothetical protein